MFHRRSDSGDGSPKRPQVTSLKGVFAEGIWHCNCDPRLPADRFQTKNGGKNHGRWFYTCQKSHPKRCGFFLWDDEAKPREARTVLGGVRTESVEPQIPSKTKPSGRSSEQATPSSPSGTISPALYPPSAATEPARTGAGTPSSVQIMSSEKDEEFYIWAETDVRDISKAVDRASMPAPATPRKAVKVDALTPPGKRRFDQMIPQTPGKDVPDVFTTPPTSRQLFPDRSTGLFSPNESPTPVRFKDALPITTFSSLRPSSPPDDPLQSDEILMALKNLQIGLSSEAITAVKDICSRHNLKTQGIAKGRDISRMAIKTKDLKILDLQRKISALEAERETSRAVIRHLKKEFGIEMRDVTKHGKEAV